MSQAPYQYYRSSGVAAKRTIYHVGQGSPASHTYLRGCPPVVADTTHHLDIYTSILTYTAIKAGLDHTQQGKEWKLRNGDGSML